MDGPAGLLFTWLGKCWKTKKAEGLNNLELRQLKRRYIERSKLEEEKLNKNSNYYP